MRITSRIATSLCLVCTSSAAMCEEPRWVTPGIDFREAQADTQNPDRGMFTQIRTTKSLGFKLDPKAKNVRVYFLIDRFIDVPIPNYEIFNLDTSLFAAEKSNQRLIVRFIYDYPSEQLVRSKTNRRSARTASPAIMSVHIRQLAAVLRTHRKAIFAVESGLIGFWGEQHGDTPDKQTPEGVASVVDQWRTALAGSEILVLARYPKAIRTYIRSDSNQSSHRPPGGLWNDCLAAYDDDNMDPPSQSVVEGETCSLNPRVDYSCSTMKGYFQSISLDLLHSEYFMPTIAQWGAEGCLEDIKRKLGYRYVIRNARLAADGSQLDLQIDNVGWGRSHISRPLHLISKGHNLKIIADLKDFPPGSVNRIRIKLKSPLSVSTDKVFLETEDGVLFSNDTGNLIYSPPKLIE